MLTGVVYAPVDLSPRFERQVRRVVRGVHERRFNLCELRNWSVCDIPGKRDAVDFVIQVPGR